MLEPTHTEAVTRGLNSTVAVLARSAFMECVKGSVE